MTAFRLLPALVLVCLASAAVPVRADHVPPKLVRVTLPTGTSLETLLAAGLDVVDVRDRRHPRLLQWPGDEAKLARLGLRAEVVDENPGLTAAKRNADELRARPLVRPARVRSAARPDGIYRTELLAPIGGGGMGGFWTLAEVKMKLDSLVANDPFDLVADKIDTIGYSRRWPIWGLKIGKKVMGPDPRPVAFLNSLTHAREPMGMQALMYFVEHLLSRYNTDPFATYLLQNRVIYIVPVVNPDGYEVNQDIYFGSPGGFGFWRKNIRDNNGNATFEELFDGVDINRNYSFRWGKDDIGSSPTMEDDTYRGPSAASEPETQVQQAIVASLAPKTGLSFHTYSDLLIHPLGHTDSATVHVGMFNEWNDELSRDNAYQTGPAPHVLYRVNGEFNDWCYGDTIAKPRAFTWTPEVGDPDDGFWPPVSRILPLAEENLRPCYVACAIAGPFVQENGVTILEGNLNAGRGARVSVRARNLGVSGTAGPNLIGTMSALDSGVHVLVSSVLYPDLGPLQNGDPTSGSTFHVDVDDTVTAGRVVRFKLDFTTPGGFFSSDTISVPVGTPTVRASDFASSGLGQWLPGSWGIVMNDPAHPSRYFTDSPPAGAPYVPGTNNVMLLAAPLNLTAGVHAHAFYEARWEVETDFDAAVVEASLNGTTWTRLRSTGTTPGSGISTQQPAGLPVYAGTRWNWRPERADLSAFTGPAASAVRFRIRVDTDFGTEFDGFAFDSLRIVVYDPAAQPGPAAVGGPGPHALELAGAAPNPARASARFDFTLPVAGPARLEVLDVQGRRIRTLMESREGASPGRYVREWDLRDDGGRRAAPGVYLARLSTLQGVVTRRFVVAS